MSRCYCLSLCISSVYVHIGVYNVHVCIMYVLCTTYIAVYREGVIVSMYTTGYSNMHKIYIIYTRISYIH